MDDKQEQGPIQRLLGALAVLRKIAPDGYWRCDWMAGAPWVSLYGRTDGSYSFSLHGQTPLLKDQVKARDRATAVATILNSALEIASIPETASLATAGEIDRLRQGIRRYMADDPPHATDCASMDPSPTRGAPCDCGVEDFIKSAG